MSESTFLAILIHSFSMTSSSEATLGDGKGVDGARLGVSPTGLAGTVNGGGVFCRSIVGRDSAIGAVSWVGKVSRRGEISGAGSVEGISYDPCGTLLGLGN